MKLNPFETASFQREKVGTNLGFMFSDHIYIRVVNNLDQDSLILKGSTKYAYHKILFYPAASASSLLILYGLNL